MIYFARNPLVFSQRDYMRMFEVTEGERYFVFCLGPITLGNNCSFQAGVAPFWP